MIGDLRLLIETVCGLASAAKAAALAFQISARLKAVPFPAGPSRPFLTVTTEVVPLPVGPKSPSLRAPEGVPLPQPRGQARGRHRDVSMAMMEKAG